MTGTLLLSSVALTEDLPRHNLTRGQVGTVVEFLEHEGEQAFLVEFCDEDGQTLAIVDLRPGQLLALHRRTDAA